MIPNLNERETQMLDILMSDPTLSVSAMGKEAGVSTVTVRSALNSLAEKGVIVRTWGGASPAFHPEILARQRLHQDAKARIAKAAAARKG